MNEISTIIINLKVLKELNISFDDYISLIKFYLFNQLPTNLEELIDKGFIVNISNRYIIVHKIRRILLDNLLDNSKGEKEVNTTDNITKEVKSRLNEFRLKWRDATNNRKPGIMGSKKACEEKLIQWMKENPEYSFDQVLAAADLYLDSVENIKYIQRADYFISKKEGTTVSSRLSAFIDEIDVYQPGQWNNELL